MEFAARGLPEKANIHFDSSHKTYLKAYGVVDQMIPEVLEESAGSVEHSPARAVDIKMGLDLDLSVLRGSCRCRELDLILHAPQIKNPLHAEIGQARRHVFDLPCGRDREGGPGTSGGRSGAVGRGRSPEENMSVPLWGFRAANRHMSLIDRARCRP